MDKLQSEVVLRSTLTADGRVNFPVFREGVKCQYVTEAILTSSLLPLLLNVDDRCDYFYFSNRWVNKNHLAFNL